MIVPPKNKPTQVKLRLDPDLIARIERIAGRANRTINETTRLLIEWALVRSEAEFDELGDAPGPLRRKKQ